MSINKLTASSTSSSAPKTGTAWCLKDRHADGRGVHRHFAREGEAKTVENRLRAERVGGDPVVRRARRTFEDYAEEWHGAQTWKDADTARYSLKRTYPVIGSKLLTAIDGLTLQMLQRRLFERYKRSTVEQSMHFTKAALRQAHADGLVAKDSTTRVRLPRRDSLDTNGKVTPEQVPTTAEALAIISGAPLRYRAGVALGLGCGLRVGEVLGLTPSRVNLAVGEITIDRQYQRGRLDSPKTWRGVRTIEPPDLVLTELRRAIRPGMAPEMPLFEGARGGTLRRDDFYARAWRPALIGAGLERDRYKFHSARHYAVSAMLGRGVSVVEVAAYVGDAPETIISTYAHFLRESRSLAKVALDLSLSGVLVDSERDESRDKRLTGGPISPGRWAR